MAYEDRPGVDLAGEAGENADERDLASAPNAG